MVTGGAGFIGSHIAEEIVREGLGDVVIFDNLSSGNEANIAHLRAGVRFVKGDTRNTLEVMKAMEGVDYVFHQAAFVSAFDSYNKPQLANDVNIGGTFNVLDAARKAGAMRVVLASSAAIYGTESQLPNREKLLPAPESPYAISKACNEYHARLFSKYWGLETVCLRYFNVFGPRQDPSSEYSGVISRFVEAISRGKNPIIYGDGSQTRDFVYVKDVARANIRAALADACGKGEIINVGTGRETSLLDVIGALREVYGREINPEFRPWRDGDIRRSVASTDLAKRILGIESTADFVSGMRFLAEASRV